MQFDIKATLRAMLGAAQAVLGTEWPKVQQCLKNGLEQERKFLAELAQAHLTGEIDDDALAQQLLDEQRTLEDTLMVCSVLSKKLAQDAANAAIDALNAAIKAALVGLLGAAHARRGGAGKIAPSLKLKNRRLNARPDTADFRDLMYISTLVEVGTSLPLRNYRQLPDRRKIQCTFSTGTPRASVWAWPR